MTAQQNLATRNQVYLERLKSGVVAELAPHLVTLQKAITALLADYDVQRLNDLRPAEFRKLLNELDAAAGVHLRAYADGLDENMQALSAWAVEANTAILAAIVVSDVKLRVTTATKAYRFAREFPIQATGQLLAPFIQGWQAAELVAAEGLMRRAHAQGLTMQETIRAFRGTKAAGYSDGLLGKYARDAETITRTAIQHVSNAAAMSVYSENSDILDSYRWISTLDNKTSQQCKSLDQRVFKLNRGPMPPLHPNCRSRIIAEIPSDLTDDESGSKRASKGDEGGQQVDGSLSYYEWLKTQPEAFQNDALGPSRAKLFREGGLSAERFAQLNLGRNFEPLTLDQMRKLEPHAFEKAGL